MKNLKETGVLFDDDLPSSFDYLYFSEIEFKSATPSCSLSDMSPKLMHELDRLRDFLGFPLFVSSAFRPVDYELKRGRNGKSAHCKGLAIDLKCSDSQKRFQIVAAALSPGFMFTRIGIAPTFIHLDIDDTLPQCVMWLY